MSRTATMSVTEFKAKCLDLLDRLADHRLDEVTVTKRGRAVAVVKPTRPQIEAVEQLHGFMRGSVIVAGGVDLTAPVLDEHFDAETGLLHR